jgi:hypothetical protein
MRRFLLFLALSFAGTLLAVAGFTRLIDPYGYWGGPEIAGLNRFKPAAGKHLRAVKLRQIERVQPRTLLVGNSRVGVGFDPASALWPAEARPVYNLGLAGAGPAELVDTAIAAMDESRPRALVFAADFVDFRLSESEWRGGRDAVPVPAFAGGLQERVEILLSLDAVEDSIFAIAEQHKPNPAHLTEQGFDALAEYNGLVAAEGHAALFEQRQRDNVARYLSGPKRVAWPSAGGSESWRALERLADACRARGVTLTIITYPYHVDLLLAFQRSGLWPAFEDWQRRLAALAAAKRVTLWDFSRVSPQTSEQVPARGDHRPMRWYWEAGHFKAALGSLAAADLVNGTERLGRRLRPQAVEREIAAKREALAAYRVAYARDAARFDRIFAAVAGAPPAPPLQSASR